MSETNSEFMERIEQKRAEAVESLMEHLDDMTEDEWRTLVAWIAPRLCDEDQDTLMRIITRRAVDTADGRLVERLAELMVEVGVKLKVV